MFNLFSFLVRGGFPYFSTLDMIIQVALFFLPPLLPLLVGFSVGKFLQYRGKNEEARQSIPRIHVRSAIVTGVGIALLAISLHFIPGAVRGVVLWQTISFLIAGGLVVYGPYIVSRFVADRNIVRAGQSGVKSELRQLPRLLMIIGYGSIGILTLWVILPGLRWNITYPISGFSCTRAGDFLAMCGSPQCISGCGSGGEGGCSVQCLPR